MSEEYSDEVDMYTQCVHYNERRYTENNDNYGYCDILDVKFPLWNSCSGCRKNCLDTLLYKAEEA